MGKHLHKRFTVQEVKGIFERYFSKEIGVEQALALLKIKRSGFFKLLKSYREAPDDFSLDYKRTTPSRTIDEKTEAKIIKELKRAARTKPSVVVFIASPICRLRVAGQS